MNSVSFKLNRALQTRFLNHSLCHTPSTNPTKFTKKHQESRNVFPQQTQWNIKNQETQKPRIKKPIQRSREKHQQTSSPPPGAFAIAAWVQLSPPLWFVFLVFMEGLFFVDFCLGFCLQSSWFLGLGFWLWLGSIVTASLVCFLSLRGFLYGFLSSWFLVVSKRQSVIERHGWEIEFVGLNFNLNEIEFYKLDLALPKSTLLYLRC